MRAPRGGRPLRANGRAASGELRAAATLTPDDGDERGGVKVVSTPQRTATARTEPCVCHKRSTGMVVMRPLYWPGWMPLTTWQLGTAGLCASGAAEPAAGVGGAFGSPGGALRGACSLPRRSRR
jgi:hypothetical protein